MRIILHVDLDSFYASVEELRHPSLKGKPLVICMYSGREDSGAVATASYPARKLGIRSGIPLSTARSRATPETSFLPADRDLYRKVSERVMQIFRKHADAFEQRSIDEAYLDISHRCRSWNQAVTIARKIKRELEAQESLTCSVGIGPNKLIAKMASREQKPDGLTLVKPGEFQKFFWKKPVSKLFGIGPKTLQSLRKYKVKTIRDLAGMKKGQLVREFGPMKGSLLWEHANGRDKEPVQELVRKQLSRLATLPENTHDPQRVLPTLSSLIADLHKKLRSQDLKFRTVPLIAISSRLKMKTRSLTLPSPASSKHEITKAVETLLEEFLKENPGELRRVGVTLSPLLHPGQPKRQKSLEEF
jgi:DNA polymerase IV (DinB-like DNA polymerase)